MKVDEATINHNITRIADENTKWIPDADKKDVLLMMESLAEIRGAVRLGNMLKEALNV